MNHRYIGNVSRVIFALLLSACLVVVLAACAETQPVDNSTPETTLSTAGSITGTETTAATTTAPVAEGFNPLTGENNIKKGEWTRPVAVMIGNDSKSSRPQVELDKADVFMECETEGGITRIMAIFAGASRVPERLGPTRSSRPPFISMAQALGAVYIHAGGEERVIQFIKDNKVNNINLITGGAHGAAAWRDESLRNSRGTEYSMLTSGERINTAVGALKYDKTAPNPLPFSFGNVSNGDLPGNKLQVTFSPAQSVNFTYDAATKLYMKGNGTLSSSSAHKMVSGTTLAVTNVIVIYDEKFMMTETHVQFRLNSGSGLLVTGGSARNIKWTRTAGGLNFTDEGGNALVLNTGKTYMCLTAVGNKSATVTQ